MLSNDGGATWREAGGGLPPGFAVAIAEDDPDRMLYAARNRLYVSAQRRRLLELAAVRAAGHRLGRLDRLTSSSRRSEAELAARHDDGRAADLEPPPVGEPATRVQRRRPPELDALVDLDLVAEADPSVPGEMERERPGGRAGRRILGDAVGRDEDARLPALAVAREAVGAVGTRAPAARSKSGRSAATASGEASST